MESSIFLARLLGPYCIIVALGILLNLKTYRKVMEDFFKNPALVYISGVMALLFGLLVVLFHNVWAAEWTVIITVFGWLGLIKGIWLIVFPNRLAKITEAFLRRVDFLVVHLLIILLLGIFLSCVGYSIG